MSTANDANGQQQPRQEISRETQLINQLNEKKQENTKLKRKITNMRKTARTAKLKSDKELDTIRKQLDSLRQELAHKATECNQTRDERDQLRLELEQISAKFVVTHMDTNSQQDIRNMCVDSQVIREIVSSNAQVAVATSSGGTIIVNAPSISHSGSISYADHNQQHHQHLEHHHLQIHQPQQHHHIHANSPPQPPQSPKYMPPHGQAPEPIHHN